MVPLNLYNLKRGGGGGGVKLIFTEGHFNIMAATKGPVVTVRLYKQSYKYFFI